MNDAQQSYYSTSGRKVAPSLHSLNNELEKVHKKYSVYAHDLNLPAGKLQSYFRDPNKGKRLSIIDKALGNIKILEKKDVIERLLWEEGFTDENIFTIILKFYEDLVKTSGSVKALFKLLISYERIEIFDFLVDHCSKLLQTGRYGFKEFLDFSQKAEEDTLDDILHDHLSENK